MVNSSLTKSSLLIKMEIEEFEVRYSILYGLMLELNVLAIQPMEISVVFIMDKKL